MGVGRDNDTKLRIEFQMSILEFNPVFKAPFPTVNQELAPVPYNLNPHPYNRSQIKYHISDK